MKIKRLNILMLITLSIATINLKVMAQNGEKYTEIKTVRTSEIIDVSADSLWEIINQPDISVWSTLLDSTKFFGTEKFEGILWSKRVSIVNYKGHHESHEDLIFYDPVNRIIKFASTKFPRFIISNQTHYEVVDHGHHKSALKTTTLMNMKKFQAFFLKKPMLKAINKNGDGLAYDIKYYAENGDVSPSKKDRIKELEKDEANQKPKYKIVEKTLKSEIINISADSLWAICREFDKTAEWTSTLKHSYGTGESQFEGATCSSRICETDFGKGKVIEELVMFSDENKELSYNLTEGAPGFITLANNHWRVTKIGNNQSKIEMNVTMYMKKFAGFFLSGLIKNQMIKQVGIVLEELKIYAETGEISEAKKKQIEKQKKK
ncbi:SRPBCC family protein [uncultured Algibacter sp.]|uniref:SRPBCC family protein n=1 Tax=uncultured Algibacter sp. TaxID=298659 RepID=UPI00262E50F2|nr:SRPBCC family protein [uncultured Algibacter sp.]